MSDLARAANCSLVDVGIACALGRSVGAVWPRLIAGDVSGLVERDFGAGPRLFGVVEDPLPEIEREFADLDCRNNRIALLALRQIEDGVVAARERFGPERIAVVVGTSTSGISDAEEAFAHRARAGCLSGRFSLGQLEHGGLADFLARVCGARGPRYTISTACSSAAKAIASARALIALGASDAVITGGVDSLCRLTAQGFGALQAIARGRTNPMSRHRDGLTLGEGGAIFLVTRDAGGVQMLGTGESSDAHHMSAPEPGGAGMAACMRTALADARLGPESIGYLNLHGTGTPQNDATEAAAVATVLGLQVPCSSTKPLVGHALGASGALEAAFCWMVLANREAGGLRLPPHRWDEVPDPSLPPIALVGKRAVSSASPPVVMSNSFGFGGSNCCLIFGVTQPCAQP